MKSPEVRFYTRKGCGLCDEAFAILKRHELTPVCIDIDEHPEKEYRQKFNFCVPVVEIDGKVRFRGHVNELLLRRLLRHARSS